MTSAKILLISISLIDLKISLGLVHLRLICDFANPELRVVIVGRSTACGIQ
jgi:hypothetical protein